MKNTFIRLINNNNEEFANGLSVIIFFLIFLPLYYFEINSVFSFLFSFGICFFVYYLVKSNEAKDLTKAVEEFEKNKWVEVMKSCGIILKSFVNQPV